MKTLDFFFAALKMKISEQMIYKFNFFLRTATLLTFDLILPFITILVYLRSNGFPGWDLNQILLFQGVFILVNSIDRMFFQRVDWTLSHHVRSGEFDRYLLFPVNPLFYLSFTNFGLEQIANLVVGICVILYASFKMGFSFGISQIILFLIFILAALLFVYALAVFKFALIIRAVYIGRIGELFRVVKDYGRYPVDIYGAFISTAFRYILPLSLLSFVPSSILLNRLESSFFIIFAVVIFLFFLSTSVWNRTLKFYTSAGG